MEKKKNNFPSHRAYHDVAADGSLLVSLGALLRQIDALGDDSLLVRELLDGAIVELVLGVCEHAEEHARHLWLRHLLGQGGDRILVLVHLHWHDLDAHRCVLGLHVLADGNGVVPRQIGSLQSQTCAQTAEKKDEGDEADRRINFFKKKKKTPKY
jgi:hypothetical protein